MLHHDFETRSFVDVNKVGAYQYWDHPTTEPTMLAWAIDEAPVRVWLLPVYAKHVMTVPDWIDVGDMPAPLRAALLDPKVTKGAHNFTFERLGHKRMGLDIGLEAWDCTAARAAAIGLPRSLEHSVKALKLSVQKDAEGHRLMLQMCKPRAARKDELKAIAEYEKRAALFPDSDAPMGWRPPQPPFWFEDETRILRLAEYCRQDVVTERALGKALPALRPEERETWLLTERMNDRGVLIDQGLVSRALDLIAEEEAHINETICERTGGAVPRVSDHGALKRWLLEQGLDVDSTDKASVAAMLDGSLDPLVRSILEIRRDGGGSSQTKWKALQARTSADGRLRGALVYCGAAATGRWSSKGVQLQNLPGRVSLRDLDGAIRDVSRGMPAWLVSEIHGPPLVVASALLRPSLIAARAADETNVRAVLARGDYSQIEARVNPWLAGAEWKLDAFRAFDAGTGPDLYKVTAAGILHKKIEDITKDERQGCGKIPDLSLGFGGGAGALQNMAKNFGFPIPHQPRLANGLPVEPVIDGTDEWIKRHWRAANPEIVALWKGLETTAIRCMNQPPGTVLQVWTLDPNGDPMHKVQGVTFRRSNMALIMTLPSGRPLFYWWPRLKPANTPFGVRVQLFYHAEDSQTKQWKEYGAYGGLLCENLVQATARDIMADALLRMYAHGILPVLTVHDEGVAEIDGDVLYGPGVVVPEHFPEDAAALVERLMLVPPAWTAGLPIAADSSAGPRYVK